MQEGDGSSYDFSLILTNDSINHGFEYQIDNFVQTFHIIYDMKGEEYESFYYKNIGILENLDFFQYSKSFINDNCIDDCKIELHYFDVDFDKFNFLEDKEIKKSDRLYGNFHIILDNCTGNKDNIDKYFKFISGRKKIE